MTFILLKAMAVVKPLKTFSVITLQVLTWIIVQNN